VAEANSSHVLGIFLELCIEFSFHFAQFEVSGDHILTVIVKPIADETRGNVVSISAKSAGPYNAIKEGGRVHRQGNL
jgi:hypothetical protein